MIVSFVNFFILQTGYIYIFVICLFTPMPTAMATIEQATQLLDFSQKLDITLLDSVVSCFYMAHGPQVIIFVLYFQVVGSVNVDPASSLKKDNIFRCSNEWQTRF